MSDNIRQRIAERIEKEYYEIMESMKERCYKFADIAIEEINRSTDEKTS